ncbi:MAG: acetyl ornithine aminotransferase family protein [Planctomycetota bacterium]|jgi:4-aminobutyrate aminotransferase
MSHAPEIKTPLPGPKAKALIERDGKVVSPAYTRGYPLSIDHGKGTYLWDVDGNKFIDFTAGVAVNALGHCHPEVVKAVTEQAGKFLHMAGTDFYYDVLARLSEKLCAAAPGNAPKSCFLCNSGAEAVEAAMKLARWVTRRPKYLAFYEAFHGRTFGALSLTASKAIQRQGFAPLLDVVHAPYGDLDFIRNRLFKRTAPPEDIAAIFVEPIQGEGGYNMPPDGFLQGLREICDEHGILLVDDEIQAGLGRTGKMFAIEHWGVEPDIITLAKPVGGGLPLGAIISRTDLQKWPSGAHANTFGGNPLACAAGIKVIELVEKEYCANAKKMGDLLGARFEDLAKRFDFLTRPTGLGLMRGIRVVKPDGAPDPERRNAIVDKCFELGLLILGCGDYTVRFLPPLTVSEPEMKAALDVFEKASKSF